MKRSPATKTRSPKFAPITLSEHDGVRYLHFGTEWVQGAMRVARPFALELEYTREMMLPLLLHGDEDTSNDAAASRRVAQELLDHGIEAEFRLVPGGGHLDAYLLDAPGIFDFLDRH